MRNLKVEFAVLAVLIGIFLGRIPDTLAKRAGWNDFVNVIVDLRSELVTNYVTEPDGELLMEGAIQGMLDTLKDPYTNYMAPKELQAFNKQTQASFSGIGAQIGQENKQLTIVSPLEDSPAIKAGIRAGDLILEIDGVSTAGYTVEKAVEKITGKEGTEVKIKVRHTDGKEEVISIIRQRIKIQTVKGFDRDKDQHWDYFIDKDNKIGYIRLTQFSEPTVRELAAAIESLNKQNVKALVLDLRYNPGGLLSAAIEVSDMFLDKGDIVSTKGRNSPKQEWKANPETIVPTDLPLTVHVNEYSASASEIVSGALRDNNRALIIGTRSYGKGSVQQLLGLRDGAGALKLTTAYYYLPSGRNIHKREGADQWGVDPTDGYYLPMTIEQMNKMNELRRNSDVIDDKVDENKSDKHTPKFIEDTLADPQLALALKTLVAKVKTGKFLDRPAQSATVLAQLTEYEKRKKDREALNEALIEINKKIETLNESLAKHGVDAEKMSTSSEKEKTDEAKDKKEEAK